MILLLIVHVPERAVPQVRVRRGDTEVALLGQGHPLGLSDQNVDEIEFANSEIEMRIFFYIFLGTSQNAQ